MKCLLIEDDEETASHIVSGLGQHGHVVEHGTDVRTGILLGADQNYAVLIVDRMLPGGDGLSLVKALRASDVSTPVLFPTTLGGIDDRVAGLEAGGDDYLVKPFAINELLACLDALARRPKDLLASSTRLRVHDLELDRLNRTVKRQGNKINLQPREYQLLEYLMRNSGRVVTKTMLLENVWAFHFDPKTNIVETHVSLLRNKVDKDFDAELIRTVRGSGYMICEPD
ncbi:MAG: response regulator transcription factor [Hyphomicrobiaceae bacterium]